MSCIDDGACLLCVLVDTFECSCAVGSCISVCVYVCACMCVCVWGGGSAFLRATPVSASTW